MKRSKTSTLTICGLDEVGRGPLAGPLVAAAVVFPADFSFAKTFPDFHLRDSKLMRRDQHLRDRVGEPHRVRAPDRRA
jgi:ribonuclease HII